MKKKIALNTVEDLSLVDQVEISLQKYFNDEDLKPGDPIPKETELAAAMGVSRTAIREALTRLKLLGLVDSKRNRGMIITRPDVLSNIKRVMDPQLMDGDTMKEFFELRLVLEMGIGDLLFIKKNSGKLNELEEIVIREENTVNQIEKIKLDVEFHSMLYKMSENKSILQFQKMLIPVFDYVNNALQPKTQIIDEKFVSHRKLLDILKDGTPEEFRINMRNHLIHYFEKV